MLLTITCTQKPATDLSWLLHKHPEKCQTFPFGFGNAHVFYPEVSDERTCVALLLDLDPVRMVRGRPGTKDSGPIDAYVNDRPYVVSSLMSVAMARVFGTALQGKCSKRPELPDTPMPLMATLNLLPCKGGETVLRKLFEPLGYTVTAEGVPLDPKMPDFGMSPYFNVTLEAQCTLKALLNHLYVLIPVLDNYKHYFVGDAEIEKLIKRGEGWLKDHPEMPFISRRYLKYQQSLAKRAISTLSDAPLETESTPDASANTELTPKLNTIRHKAIIEKLREHGAIHVMDLGCGEGRLLKRLLREKGFGKLLGLDVSTHTLAIAAERLKLNTLNERQQKRIQLVHGSLMYRDRRLDAYDSAAVVEVIEHLEPFRLEAFERVLFEYTRPRTVVLTTPNREYNALFTQMQPGKLRHRDHQFEWTRAQFAAWTAQISERFGYHAGHFDIGDINPEHGPVTQGVVFTRQEVHPDEQERSPK